MTAKKIVTTTRAAIAAQVPEWRALCDRQGRVTPRLQQRLLDFEARHGAGFAGSARAAFQQFVAEAGARQRAPIAMPEDDTPYWLLGEHPLAGHGATATLPAKADVVVIGAGLTGASVAYHLSLHAPRGLKIVLLDAGDPATQASGRNGGNFELMPENFLGEYEGLPKERAKWIRRRHPRLDDDVVEREAVRQATLILRWGTRNAKRFLSLVRDEKIACDLSTGGWLRIADTAEEEEGIVEEVAFARRLGVKLELLTPAEIRRKIGIPARFQGRLARGNGNYHPFRFVTGLVEASIRRGVRLFTRTPVERVRPSRAGARVETSRGAIEAGRVVFATNAFTSELLPSLAGIRCYQSQIMNLEHVPDAMRGMTVTEKKGDLYYNFPAARRYRDAAGASRGMLHVGGGLDRAARNPHALRRSPQVLELVKAQADERFPQTRGQPPSRVWTGPMAFTPDRLPAIGLLRERGFASDALVVAAGCNGYGGTWCIEAGHVAAAIALDGRPHADAPEDMFSPDRLVALARPA